MKTKQELLLQFNSELIQSYQALLPVLKKQKIETIDEAFQDWLDTHYRKGYIIANTIIQEFKGAAGLGNVVDKEDGKLSKYLTVMEELKNQYYRYYKSKNEEKIKEVLIAIQNFMQMVILERTGQKVKPKSFFDSLKWFR